VFTRSPLIFVLLCTVCVTAGYIMSYWNRPFFPEGCADATLHSPVTYDTMVRIAGSFSGIAQAFKVVADKYGWTHIVLVADDDTSMLCWFLAKPFDALFSNNKNYTFTWLRLGSQPTDQQLDDVLQQIRSHARGSSSFTISSFRTLIYFWSIATRRIYLQFNFLL